MEIKNSNPQKDGYYLAPEWHHHGQSYMMWPQRTDNWREGAKPVQKVFTEIATKISRYEPVTMLVSREQYQHVHRLLSKSIRVVEMSYNDAWMRDIGPAYLINHDNKRRTVNWQFNAWGGIFDGLYFPWDQDNLVAKKTTDLDRLDYYNVNFVLEGCGYQTDGEGTLIVVEESVLSEGRNGEVKRDFVENILMEYLNVSKVIWLKQGYFMDETNGDVDNLVTFIRPGEVALNWTEDRNDPMFIVTHEAFEILNRTTDAKGRQLKINKISLPSPLMITEEESHGIDLVNGRLPRYTGDRLTASYVNCYLANGAVILPVFGDKNDQIAIKQYQKLFPARKIEPVYARELLLGGGNIHSVVLGTPD